MDEPADASSRQERVDRFGWVGVIVVDLAGSVRHRASRITQAKSYCPVPGTTFNEFDVHPIWPSRFTTRYDASIISLSPVSRFLPLCRQIRLCQLLRHIIETTFAKTIIAINVPR